MPVSEILSKGQDADVLFILTAVEQACLNYGKPEQRAGIAGESRHNHHPGQGIEAPWRQSN